MLCQIRLTLEDLSDFLLKLFSLALYFPCCFAGAHDHNILLFLFILLILLVLLALLILLFNLLIFYVLMAFHELLKLSGSIFL